MTEVQWIKVSEPPKSDSRPGFSLLTVARAFPTPGQGVTHLTIEINKGRYNCIDGPVLVHEWSPRAHLSVRCLRMDPRCRRVLSANAPTTPAPTNRLTPSTFAAGPARRVGTSRPPVPSTSPNRSPKPSRPVIDVGTAMSTIRAYELPRLSKKGPGVFAAGAPHSHHKTDAEGRYVGPFVGTSSQFCVLCGRALDQPSPYELLKPFVVEEFYR